MADLRCESCGIPWSEHLGCQVLCSQLAALAETVERQQGRLADVLQHNEVLSANNERLAEANLELRELLECKDQLLACYRVNRRPPEKLLSRLAELNAEVLGGQS